MAPTSSLLDEDNELDELEVELVVELVVELEDEEDESVESSSDPEDELEEEEEEVWEGRCFCFFLRFDMIGIGMDKQRELPPLFELGSSVLTSILPFFHSSFISKFYSFQTKKEKKIFIISSNER